MSRILFKLLMTGAFLALAPGAVADHELVLVVAQDSPITEVDARTIRKAYFGISVDLGDGRIRPYLLAGDSRLNRIFMQSVIAMSERSYERRLLALTLKYGAPRPERVGSPEELVAVLTNHPLAMGYMWSEDAESASGIRVVRTLWRAD